MVEVGRNPEETFAIASVEDKTIDIITVETSFEDLRSPIPKKKICVQKRFTQTFSVEIVEKCLLVKMI